MWETPHRIFFFFFLSSASECLCSLSLTLFANNNNNTCERTWPRAGEALHKNDRLVSF
jgi:hypothetical protein